MSDSDWVKDPTFAIEQDSDWERDPTFKGEDADEPRGLAPSIADKVSSGLTGGFFDELSGGLDAAGRVFGIEGAGGPMKDIKLAEGGPTLDLDALKQSYIAGRDRTRGQLKQAAIDHPIASNVAELGGAVFSPINKIAKGASLAKAGAAIGGINGLGYSSADNAGDLAKDALIGAAMGGGLGGTAGLIRPQAAKAANAMRKVTPEVFEKAGGRLGRSAGGILDSVTFNGLGTHMGSMLGEKAGKSVGRSAGSWIQKMGMSGKPQGSVSAHLGDIIPESAPQSLIASGADDVAAQVAPSGSSPVLGALKEYRNRFDLSKDKRGLVGKTLDDLIHKVESTGFEKLSRPDQINIARRIGGKPGAPLGADEADELVNMLLQSKTFSNLAQNNPSAFSALADGMRKKVSGQADGSNVLKLVSPKEAQNQFLKGN